MPLKSQNQNLVNGRPCLISGVLNHDAPTSGIGVRYIPSSVRATETIVFIPLHQVFCHLPPYGQNEGSRIKESSSGKVRGELSPLLFSFPSEKVLLKILSHLGKLELTFARSRSNQVTQHPQCTKGVSYISLQHIRLCPGSKKTSSLRATSRQRKLAKSTCPRSGSQTRYFCLKWGTYASFELHVKSRSPAIK